MHAGGDRELLSCAARNHMQEARITHAVDVLSRYSDGKIDDPVPVHVTGRERGAEPVARFQFADARRERQAALVEDLREGESTRGPIEDGDRPCRDGRTRNAAQHGRGSHREIRATVLVEIARCQRRAEQAGAGQHERRQPAE
jgi:hypothetical protein